MWSFMYVRTVGDPGAAIAAIRASVASLGRQSIESVHLEAEHVDIALARERLAATLGGLFALLSIGLVALGSYGLFSHWVTRRTRELGVRLALGASPAELRRWILRQSAGLTAAGIGLGVPITFIVARVAGASSFLFGLTTHDPVVLVGAIGVLLAVATSAVLGPASRVFRVDPLSALRSE